MTNLLIGGILGVIVSAIVVVAVLLSYTSSDDPLDHHSGSEPRPKPNTSKRGM